MVSSPVLKASSPPQCPSRPSYSRYFRTPMAYSPLSSSSSSPFLPHSPSPRNVSFEHMRSRSESSTRGGDKEVDLETLVRVVPPPAYTWNIRNSTSKVPTMLRSRRVLAIIAILLFLVAFATFSVVHVSNGEHSWLTVPETSVADEKEEKSPYPQQVLGPPTGSFRDNLRDDTQYITGWINAGWTNDVMTYMNLLYLAVLTNRTAVLGPFAPSHLSRTAGIIPFGEVYDIPRLNRLLSVPVIEWSDLKVLGTDEYDELGCWSVWATGVPAGREVTPRWNPLAPHLGVDVAYTPVPEKGRLLERPKFGHDPHIRFSSLVPLTFPDGRRGANLPGAARYPAERSGHTMLPDEQFACFDFLYYVATDETYEMEYDWSPVWRFIGTHVHWTPRIEAIAIEYIRKTFGVEDGEETPPFISMHVRHGDFGIYCENQDGGDGCFAPLSEYMRRVEEVQSELLATKGIEVTRVLVTSDERNVEWWAGVREMGWEWVDHAALQTEEQYGKWYPVFLDAVVQSLGAGFVGTDRSTMSLVAARRVQDWSGGPSREVKWGHWAEEEKQREQEKQQHQKRSFEYDSVYDLVI